MNEAGIRVAKRAGPQAQGVLTGRPEPAGPQRPAWPFTVRDADKNASSAAASLKPSTGFKT